MSRPGDSFTEQSYVPRFGDVVHVDWSPSMGHEMRGPHYGLVLSADSFNIATGLVIAVPITSKADKLGGFAVPVQSGRVKGVAVLSALKSLDYRTRRVTFEGTVARDDAELASQRVRLIFPRPNPMPDPGPWKFSTT